MIITKLSGGLGNQLFQYAFGKHLARINQTDHKIDASDYIGNTPDPQKGIRVCGLYNFNISSKEVTTEELGVFNFLVRNKFFRKLIRFYSNRKNYFKKKYIIEPEENYFRFDNKILNYPIKRNVYIEGYWQTEKYFLAIEDEIRKEFTFKNKPEEKNKEILEKIISENSVCIHVRHSDNVHIKGGVILELEYYKKATKEMKEKTDNPIFYIFSDDPKWAKENIKLNSPTKFISHNGDEKNYEDLRLMIHCKHHIIGNSTFSWWGAWLGKKEGQIVICPKQYLDDKFDIPNTDYKPKEWKFI